MTRRALGRLRAAASPRLARARREYELRRDMARSRLGGADVAFFHELAPPPSGGGNQFLAALAGEFARRGVAVEWNRLSRRTPACLFNSFNFDLDRLQRFARTDVRMVHRVDGPIATYRGWDDGTDGSIARMNAAFASATVFQSRYSLQHHSDLGYELRDPHVIRNAVDPAIFNRVGRVELRTGERVRLIATSWSDNPNKGSDLFAALEDALDPKRFELTYVGRSPRPFTRARLIPPVPSAEVARLLRDHHVFLALSRHEACSNALLEALACGLPCLYVDSGSNGEITGDGGLGFTSADEMPDVLERLIANWDEHQNRISIPSLTQVADAYLEVLEIEG